MRVVFWARYCITCSDKLLSECNVPNLDNCLFLASAGISKSRKWGRGKEGKILFQFTLILFTVWFVTFQLCKGLGCGTSLCACVRVVYMLLVLFSSSSKKVSADIYMLFTTGLNQDQIPLWGYVQTATDTNSGSEESEISVSLNTRLSAVSRLNFKLWWSGWQLQVSHRLSISKSGQILFPST